MRALHLPLVMAPVAGLAAALAWDPRVAFAAAALGLVGAGALLSDAIEGLAARHGPRLGRLLQAILGGAVLLVLGALALDQGLHDLVKASLVGAILANLVLALGLCTFLGGLRHRNQYFNRERASHTGTLMVLAVVALGLPALYGTQVPIRNAGPVESLSEAVAVVMLGLYLLIQYYELVWLDAPLRSAAPPAPVQPSPTLAYGVLVLALGLVLGLGAILIKAAGPVLAALRIAPAFLGIVVIPLISYAATHNLALRAAWRNRMDVALDACAESSLQVILWVAPLLVFASLLLGRPMDLVFSTIELAAMAAAAAVAALVSLDGESNWLEGAMLIAVYLLIGLAFYWWPV